MENAADALKMAGSVLLFVIALSVAILAFSQAREAIDAVLKYSDRESLTITSDDRFYYLASSSDTRRYVGKETIIPTIYRAYKENFKIVFEFPDDYYLYTNSAGEKVCKIDLANQNLASDLQSRQFLNGIIYGDFEYEPSKTQSNYETLFRIKPNPTTATSGGLYKYLTDKEGSYKIEEKLGTYYVEDLKTDPSDTSQKSNVEDVNKQEKRVITYTFKTI